MENDMNNDQLYFYNRGFNDCLAKCLDTPSAKTLTDEEIIEEIKLLPQLISMEDKDFIGFARAILKKASEK
jgi:hypothetical protein